MTVLLLAAGTQTPTRAEAGPLALLIIVGLAIVTFALIKNMSGRLKRMPKEFPAERAAREAREARERRDEGPAPQD